MACFRVARDPAGQNGAFDPLSGCHLKACPRSYDESEARHMERAKSIHLLNSAVSDELQAVHQYMYFHFHLDDQGFKPLAQLFKKIAI
jgi:rubrerythrin